jgi:hypothetical protein
MSGMSGMRARAGACAGACAEDWPPGWAWLKHVSSGKVEHVYSGTQGHTNGSGQSFYSRAPEVVKGGQRRKQFFEAMWYGVATALRQNYRCSYVYVRSIGRPNYGDCHPKHLPDVHFSVDPHVPRLFASRSRRARGTPHCALSCKTSLTRAPRSICTQKHFIEVDLS